MANRKDLILLLEDDVAQALIFQSMAAGTRHDFVSTDNVTDAIGILKRSTIVACVVDLGVYRNYPKFDSRAGIEFISRARDFGARNIPIIVVTASRDPNVLIPCFEAGCDDYVLKDEGITKVVARLKAWLRILPISQEKLEEKRAETLRKLRNILKS